MSDQLTVNNQARPSAAAPILLGAVGAGAGAAFSPFVKKGYKSYEELLAMSKDTFEPVKKAAEALDGNEEIKTVYNELVEDRKNLAELETIIADKLKNEDGLDEILKKCNLGEETKKAFKEAMKDAETAIANAADDTAKKAAKEAYDKQAVETLKKLVVKDSIKENADDVVKNMKTLKKILPKGKWLGGIVFAAAGLLLGRIIAKASANKKNQA